MPVTAKMVSVFEELLRFVSVGAGGKREESTWKGHNGTLWNDANFQHIDRILNYKGMCICQNSLNIYLIFVQFY